MTKSHTQALIVVGVDGSSSSRTALRWAASFAATSGARLEVIMAWHILTTYVGPGYVPSTFELSIDHEKILNEVVDDVFGPDRPTYITLRAEEGNAAHLLIEASKEAELVVVGSRGHGGFAGLLLGSVSAKLAEHSCCPVLIHHGDIDAAGDD